MKNMTQKKDCLIGFAAGTGFAVLAMAAMSLFCTALPAEKLNTALPILQIGAFAAVIFAALFALSDIKSLLIRAAVTAVSAVFWLVLASAVGAAPKIMNLFGLEMTNDNNAAGLIFILLCVGCLIAYVVSAAVSLVLRRILRRNKAEI